MKQRLEVEDYRGASDFERSLGGRKQCDRGHKELHAERDHRAVYDPQTIRYVENLHDIPMEHASSALVDKRLVYHIQNKPCERIPKAQFYQHMGQLIL